MFVIVRKDLIKVRGNQSSFHQVELFFHRHLAGRGVRS